ncbi:uncharacterized protein LAESUDRAFT_710926 [Laetiporus sulphureus 93-53]|uniref:Uncharacterized protein n=1 Tax=Laetiporus sulphureus 93-53 TaxID=1314785 RepID=A0A165H9C1_9APHY|nr:uncharacterized protein LAESUDRAFT_710926 [Laetiporus sulphureus 93-53]KZT11422.1 hypothetical protein LAESUDRAFT_710926 [Laetiporus sulphureus 93-53]
MCGRYMYHLIVVHGSLALAPRISDGQTAACMCRSVVCSRVTGAVGSVEKRKRAAVSTSNVYVDRAKVLPGPRFEWTKIPVDTGACARSWMVEAGEGDDGVHDAPAARTGRTPKCGNPGNGAALNDTMSTIFCLSILMGGDSDGTPIKPAFAKARSIEESPSGDSARDERCQRWRSGLPLSETTRFGAIMRVKAELRGREAGEEGRDRRDKSLDIAIKVWKRVSRSTRAEPQAHTSSSVDLIRIIRLRTLARKIPGQTNARLGAGIGRWLVFSRVLSRLLGGDVTSRFRLSAQLFEAWDRAETSQTRAIVPQIMRKEDRMWCTFSPSAVY